jgi:hypothetical protein
MLIYIKFSFDFLSLDNVDFENYFANKLINMGRYLSHLNTAFYYALIRYKMRGANLKHSYACFK